MIVIDASSIAEVLLQSPKAARIVGRVFSPGGSVHAPHLIDIEIVSIVRRYFLRGDVSEARGAQMLDIFKALPIERHDHEALIPRIWQLRNNLSAYDATYVALAEGLTAPLVTSDRRLANAAGIRAIVEVY